MAETRWYYARNKQKAGPVTLSELRSLVEAKQLQPGDMVCQQGSTKWQAVSTVLNVAPTAAGARIAPAQVLTAAPPGPPRPLAGKAPAAVAPAASPAGAAAARPSAPAAGRDTAPPGPASTQAGAAGGARSPRTVEKLPEQFGRYRILKHLGKGGMGAVYLAHDTQLDRQVALKVPHFSADDGPKLLERFHREARAAATLQHANICPVFDVGEINGIHYLTMAYIEGKPLAQLVDPAKPLPIKQVALLIRKLALALQEAHRRGIIHRDLKPSNIMINPRKEPVVMDFGLARRVDKDDVRVTRKNAVLGTPGYMSPEQIGEDAANAGPASDIYSLGIILYELLTGRLPFEGPLAAVLGQIIARPPDPPSRLRAEVDPPLEAICLKAVAKKPAERYASMAAFAAALGEYLRADGVAATSTAGKAPAPATAEQELPVLEEFQELEKVPPPPRRRGRRLAAAAGLVLLTGGAFAGWHFLANREEPVGQVAEVTNPITPPAPVEKKTPEPATTEPVKPPAEPPVKPPNEPVKPPAEGHGKTSPEPAKALALVQQAGDHIGQRQYTQAVALCDEALKLDPNLAAAYDRRGVAQRNLRRKDQAVADATAAVALDPKSAEAFKNRAWAYNNQGEYQKALEDCNQALKLDAKLAEAHAIRGLVHCNLKDPTKGVADASLAVALDPRSPVAHNVRGLALRDQNRLDDAITEFGEAIRADPYYRFAYVNRGSVYERLGKYPQAIEDYHLAIQIDPTVSETYVTRALAVINRGLLTLEIEADLAQAIRLDPGNYGAFTVRGFFHLKFQDFDQSIADLTEALRINPKHVPAYLNRGEAYVVRSIRMGVQAEFDKGVADFEQAIKLDPKTPRLGDLLAAFLKPPEELFRPKTAQDHVDRGRYYAAGKTTGRGEPLRFLKAAVLDYNEALRLDPKSRAAFYWRGKAHADLKEHDKAIADFSEAIKLDPKYMEAYHGRAMVCVAKGDHDQAIKECTDLLRTSSKDPEAYYWRAQAYQARGKALDRKEDYTSAITDLTAAIKLSPNHELAYSVRAGLHDLLGNAVAAKADRDRLALIMGLQATARTQNKLAQPINLDKGIDPNTQLKDALEFLSDRYDLTILIDTKAFQAIGVPKVEEQRVQLPRMAAVPLDTVLRLLVSQVQGDGYGGAFIVRKDVVEITTSYHANNASFRLLRDKPTVKEKLDTTLNTLGISEAPLTNVLGDLVDATGLKMTWDGTVAAKSKAPVKLPRLEDVTFGTMLHLLASQVGGTIQLTADGVQFTASKTSSMAAIPVGRSRSVQEVQAKLQKTLATTDAGYTLDSFAAFLSSSAQRFNLVIDDDAFEQRKIVGVRQRPIKLTKGQNTVDAILRSALKQIPGSTFVVRDNVILIVPAN